MYSCPTNISARDQHGRCGRDQQNFHSATGIGSFRLADVTKITFASVREVRRLRRQRGFHHFRRFVRQHQSKLRIFLRRFWHLLRGCRCACSTVSGGHAGAWPAFSHFCLAGCRLGGSRLVQIDRLMAFGCGFSSAPQSRSHGFRQRFGNWLPRILLWRRKLRGWRFRIASVRDGVRHGFQQGHIVRARLG